MRSMRSSISCWMSHTDCGSISAARRESVFRMSSMGGSAAHGREGLLERDDRREAGHAGELAPADRARVLEEIHSAGRRMVEAEAEETAEQRARDRLG